MRSNFGNCSISMVVIIILIIMTRGAIIPFLLFFWLFFFVIGKIKSFFTSKSSSNSYDQEYNEQEMYTKYEDFIGGICQLAGYISRAGGTITREQIDIISSFIDSSNERDDHNFRARLQRDFNIGKELGFDPRPLCDKLERYFIVDSELRDDLLNLLLELIYADNIATEYELQCLATITDNLSIPREEVYKKVSQFEYMSKSAQRTRSNRNQQQSRSNQYENNNRNSNQQQQRRSNQNGSNNQQRSNQNQGRSNDRQARSKYDRHVESRADALSILGVEQNATKADIKRAYLKLIKEYHPDRLKAKGITGKLKEEYELKCKLINEAYNYLK